jgi:hypothetical protein
LETKEFQFDEDDDEEIDEEEEEDVGSQTDVDEDGA